MEGRRLLGIVLATRERVPAPTERRPSLRPEPDIGVVRPDRPGIRKVLGDLEAAIMEYVWSRPAGQGVTVREVHGALYAQHRLAYTTVMNTMTRLARKHLLRAEPDPASARQAYRYFPALSQDEFVSRFVGRMLESLLVGFSGTAIERINAHPDPEAAARIRRLLTEIARRRAEEEGE